MANDSNPKEFKEQLLRLTEKADSLKDEVLDLAAKVGYIQSATKTFTSACRQIGEEGQVDAHWSEWIGSGQNIATSLENELDGLGRQVKPLLFSVDSAVSLFSNAASTGVVACNSMVPDGPIVLRFEPCPFVNNSSEEMYAKKLTELAPALGATYRAAWANRYNQRFDDGRAPLWEMRQTYDHFLFDLLAPNSAVRESVHWTPKQPPRPTDAINRDERLAFAANSWVANPNKRTVLIESAKSTLDAYMRLQQAHERNSLDRAKVQEVFLAADDILRRWIDSIEPWPPTS